MNRIPRIAGLAVLFAAVAWSGVSAQTPAWKPADNPLTTRWTRDVSPEMPLPEYPRPQMVREDWINLNGLWDFAKTDREEAAPEAFNKHILVPFPVESALSGLREPVEGRHYLWYRRTFDVPEDWADKRVLLHFGAVDWETVVTVNGRELATHRGGYDPFTVDVTEALNAEGPQELRLRVWDPTGEGGQMVGKQAMLPGSRPGGIFYTRISGVWQTVWLEAVPRTYVASFHVTPNLADACLEIRVAVAGESAVQVEAAAFDGDAQAGRVSGAPGETLRLPVPDPKLWTPDSPFLYDLKIALKNGGDTVDEVSGYFAMREISVGPDEKGVTRLLLNGEPVFQVGPLDQGYWPDGLYTAPTDEALRYDVEATKRYGFNMSRKHVKVEPARWYWWCDKLGLLVWQDMPGAGNRTDEQKSQFEAEMTEILRDFGNHPSIVMWVVFNEGWGQFDTERLVEKVREIDPSRLVSNASGWVDKGVGDVIDVHNYPTPHGAPAEEKRASVVGEFGGLGFNDPDHSWADTGWGYDLLQSRERLLERYEEVYAALWRAMEERGVSAGVYTQLTDIEAENNGLLTYDRAIAKIDFEPAEAAARRRLPPLVETQADIFIDSGEAVFRPAANRAVAMRRTLDGSTPRADSPLYEGPIRVTENTTIRIRSFFEDGPPSRVKTLEMRKVSPLAAVSVPNPIRGLEALWYEGAWDRLPDFETLRPAGRLAVDGLRTDFTGRDADFGVVYRGWIEAPETGVYLLHLVSDDGADLRIGAETLIDNDGIHGNRERTAAVALAQGPHPFVLRYFQRSGGRALDLEWSGPGFERRPLTMKDFLCRPSEAACMPPERAGATDFFVGETLVRLRPAHPASTVHYTLDGSAPTQNSPRYEAPFTVSEPTTVTARAFLDGARPSEILVFTLRKVEARPAADVADVSPGLKARLYEGRWERMPENLSAAAPVREWTAPSVDAGEAQREEWFAVTWEGFLEAPQTGVFVFDVDADDGADVSVAGNTIYRREFFSQEPESNPTIALEKGLHPLRIVYFQGYGARRFRLNWTPPGGGESQGLSSDLLFHKE